MSAIGETLSRLQTALRANWRGLMPQIAPLLGRSLLLYVRAPMRWDDFPGDVRLTWIALGLLSALIVLDGTLTLRAPGLSAAFAVALVAVGFIWMRTARDPRWGVAWSWSLLSGVCVALPVGLAWPIAGLALSLWVYLTAWRLMRALRKRLKAPASQDGAAATQ